MTVISFEELNRRFDWMRAKFESDPPDEDMQEAILHCWQEWADACLRS